MPSVLARHEGHSLECGKTQIIHKMEQKFQFVECNSLVKSSDAGEVFNCGLFYEAKYQNSCDLTFLMTTVSERQQHTEGVDGEEQHPPAVSTTEVT